MLLELFSEPDVFGFQWASTNVYNGVIYPALPDLYGPTMNVRYPQGLGSAHTCIILQPCVMARAQRTSIHEIRAAVWTTLILVSQLSARRCMADRVVMQALLDIDPNAYFLLSGTGQAAHYPGMSWGNGFVTDLNAIKQYNLSDPFYFFRDLSQAPRLLQRTILSPHVLGPDTTVSFHGLAVQGWPSLLCALLAGTLLSGAKDFRLHFSHIHVRQGYSFS